MEFLSTITQKLDKLFGVEELDKDPSFSFLLPMVYEHAGLDWQSYFEPAFCVRFNGIMLRGANQVETVYCGVLPTPQVLDVFLEQAKPGDMFFTHHPIDFEMGNPRGKRGRGPLPVENRAVEAMLAKQLTFYVCHHPMDINREIGTTLAMESALDASFQAPFYRIGDDYVGSICLIPPSSTAELMVKLKRVFQVPFVDFIGAEHDKLERVAIVAGASDKVEVIQEAESLGAQAIISGEVRSARGDAYGRAKYEKVTAYVPRTKMSLLGVSHAASKHLVMETQMVPWFKRQCQVEAKVIRMDDWWR
jgi:putative NIF3 family GTP cyclohydrolase 1 type 2